MRTAIVPQCKAINVTNASTEFGLTLMPNIDYVIVSSTAAWIKQAASNPVAVAGDPANMYIPANTLIYVSGDNGAEIAIIRDAADGKASIAPVH